MAKKVYDEESLHAFAREIDFLADSVGKLQDLQIVDDRNPVVQAVEKGSQIFLGHAQEQSPYWTGLLRGAHIVGKEEFVPTSSGGLRGKASVFIDPAETTEHEFWGGIPSVYGPEYHEQRLPWFDYAEVLAAPAFFEMVDDIFGRYLARVLR